MPWLVSGKYYEVTGGLQLNTDSPEFKERVRALASGATAAASRGRVA